MKTRKVTIKGKRLGKALYVVQLIILLPLLIVMYVANLLGVLFFDSLERYKMWFLSKF